MTDVVIRAAADAVQATQGRRIDLRLVAWDDVATSTAEGIREQLVPGAFAGVDASRVTLVSQRHGGNVVGVGESIVERSDGAYGTFRVAETQAGDELLALTRPGPQGEPPVLRDVSVEFRPIKSRTSNGIVQRTAVDLWRVAILERGAYASGAVLAVRSEPEMTEQTTPNPEATTVPPAQATHSTERADAAAQAAADLAPLIERMDAFDANLTRLATLGAVPGVQGGQHELAKYGTSAEYAAAVWTGQADKDLMARAIAEVGLMQRTAADQITTNNAGVVPPSWLLDVKRIVDLARRAINAFGGPESMPPTGMEIDWPYLNSSNTIIGAQSTQKTEVTSARVDIAKGSAALETYAGYSDISYQLLQRSSPSYREAYNRIMLAAWGAVTDAAWVADLEGATGTTTQTVGAMLGANVTLQASADSDDVIDATGHGLANGDAIVFTSLTGGDDLDVGRVYWVIATGLTADDFKFSATPGGAAADFGADISAGTVAKVTDTGAKFRAALAQASVSVEDASGQPASIVLASTDMFLMLAGLSGFQAVQPIGNATAADGTMMASTLRMESSGLLIQRSAGVSAGKFIVSNGMAGRWHEDGPRFIAAEDVAKLGQNVGVYSFAAPAIYVPAAIVEVTFV